MGERIKVQPQPHKPVQPTLNQPCPPEWGDDPIVRFPLPHHNDLHGDRLSRQWPTHKYTGVK